jgi:hypothetical protein
VQNVVEMAVNIGYYYFVNRALTSQSRPLAPLFATPLDKIPRARHPADDGI